jgi:hypothetical protein
MKIRLVGAQLFHADGRTDRQTDTTKLIVALRNFANAPKHIILPTRCIYAWNVRFALQTAISTSGLIFVQRCVVCYPDTN